MHNVSVILLKVNFRDCCTIETKNNLKFIQLKKPLTGERNKNRTVTILTT